MGNVRTSNWTQSGNLTDHYYSVMRQRPQLVPNVRAATTGVNSQKRRTVECHRSSTCKSRTHLVEQLLTLHRQVQDLQSQIAELTHVNSQLRTKVSDKEPLDSERTDTKRRLSETHAGAIPRPRPISMPVFNNFEHVRRNIRIHAQGVFSTPHYGPKGAGVTTWRLPEIPIRADFAYLSHSYTETIHEWYPAIHWPTFQREADNVYTSKTFEGCSREWIALFFAVLACGALQAGPGNTSSGASTSKGHTMYETATAVLQSWPHDVSITYAQAALILSIYATECNLRPAGSLWLSSAARMAQELQICPEVDCWPLVDGEVRRRLWWSIYVRDRYESYLPGLFADCS
jgi:hypothetical protein